MARILVLGGSGEMGSAAVADLVEPTNHEVSIGQSGAERGYRQLPDRRPRP
jgi:predicted dinucleotide-binding enzyme